MDCIFCKIAKGDAESHKVFEDEKTVAFLDNSPVARGHALVIPKEHHENVFDTPEDELKAVASTIKKVVAMLKEGLNADGVNVLNASGTPAGQVVSHLHFHVIPRNEGDGLSAFPKSDYEEEDFQGVLKEVKGE